MASTLEVEIQAEEHGFFIKCSQTYERSQTQDAHYYDEVDEVLLRWCLIGSGSVY